MLDELLIRYASPTLVGIKSGSLFKVYTDCNFNLYEEIKIYNSQLNYLDVYLDIVYSCKKYYLVYVYRLDMISSDFDNKEVIDFLKSYGYNCPTIKEYILHLKTRFKLFHKTPHEVGIFLGYPINDVKCFIKFKGKNFIMSGCWKVYDNADYYSKKFEEFKKCKEILSYLYKHNYTLESLISILCKKIKY